ncbi:hypothetical protein KVR01_010840 [Diaporthe batatas]|uniref:uncharacterized protein n=1 Tax=Diaporthe batatas TaxID=748121 RepID=UPI001D0427AC|nr:uncharacterized protein KVR01_010840 [Diaporthe batatas]KAG8159179.1 hypothetical protein KVR01_010840 [Diaporthe batatas]
MPLGHLESKTTSRPTTSPALRRMGQARTAAGGLADAVAQTTLLSAADCDLIQELQHSLSAEAANGRGCGGLLAAILDHLAHFKAHIHDDGSGTALVGTGNVWGPIRAEAHTSRGKSEVTVTITGPGPEDRFYVPLSSHDDASHTVAFVSGVDAACRAIKDIHSHCVLVIQKRQALEAAQIRLTQPADSTVSEHIRLLRQYNKVKDAGQQLIGLNADNRGVPVGSLYADEHYGVGPND